MKEKLNISYIQADLVWGNPKANRLQFQDKIRSVKQQVDLFVLPEMFTTGFTMHPKYVAEKMNGDTINWMQKIANEVKAAICGSLIIEENNSHYNRFVFVEQNGKISTYNKRHTFTLAGEHQVYTAGTEKIIIDFKGWKICPLVCYDLRFPVWARNVEDYDLLIYVANWPKPRISAWDTLLKARAIENMTYCIGVNRVGKDINGHQYTGHSVVLDGLGESLTSISENEQIKVVELNKNHIETIRKKLKFLDDKEVFNLIV
ncbi:MAG: amidohydrolase [Flavobacteriaceae bacterium]|nr:amidohydrolase [Flavobacteriaceae bacterium]